MSPRSTFRTTDDTPRPRRRAGAMAVLVTSTLLMAACGSGSDEASRPSATADETDDDGTETVPDTEVTPTTAGVTSTTTVPTTTPAGSSVPTGPSTTVPPVAEGFPGTGDYAEWLTVRRVTTDIGYFGFADGTPVVEARTWWMRCPDPACASPMIEPRLVSEFESNGTTITAEVADGALSWADVSNTACLSTTTGQVDGPAESQDTASLGLVPTDTSKRVWQGVYSRRVVTTASANCEAENVGYDADMWLFDPDAVAAADPVGTWYGETGDALGIERAVRPCEPSEGCQLKLRMAIDDPGNPAGATRMFVDFPLVLNMDGDWYGVADYDESCVSDFDGSYLTPQGYATHHEVWLSAYDLGEGSTLAAAGEMIEQKSSRTHPSLTPELAAACGDAERTTRFVGVLIDTPVLTDWAPPAEVPQPLPAG